MSERRFPAIQAITMTIQDLVMTPLPKEAAEAAIHKAVLMHLLHALRRCEEKMLTNKRMSVNMWIRSLIASVWDADLGSNEWKNELVHELSYTSDQLT
ncbi:MAG: hypothetical protein UV82_C0013G0055 [Candidatus Magasanikbacteria bacterium GW2011_GWD2_43_18]|nr:MAG: hypothetical protein UV18_C0002G0093 [Candidatus Magasanikbacteria bacterium GW2011_GWC2_42_27]KKT03971.1 MAG: hypothetical protein UV82_C0013G0055 [Candidatus Magasanikbacteria bacterium GW2011_GWD2_43_18]KKT25547.1 MAG: hypothetical protein UW10_C0006G0013 [Candidatus Magasanikbacteria bacterium GW2011_GWA2_43_9]HBB37727.1 hypothetical protein [Candidatus Magasanikbacteria bacterium]HCC13329.1 hypothetical protein [Candidatus Magasanikbacteria bacterium]